jgi:RNA polymerase sigma-70 factor, ECF subfamily
MALLQEQELRQDPRNHREPAVADLVRAAQQGDRLAFGRLVRRYERAVQAVALRRLGSHAEAQEVCQEVFIQALRKLGQIRDPRCFGGWLRSITNRMAINRAVRRAPAAATEPGALDARCVDRRTPLGAALAREREDQVRAGLKQLGPLDRETLVAFYFDGRTLVEMSEKFASPVGTIKRRLHVARQRLARQLAALAPA